MDSCGRTRTAASQLVEFLPELQTDKKFQGILPFKFSVIDDIALEIESDISKSLEDINITVVETNLNINSPQALTNTVLLFAHELRWEHLALVHSNSRFSSAMLKHFIKSLQKFDFCITWVVNVEDGDEAELQKVLESGIPILSLLPSEEHSLFLKRFQVPLMPKKKISVIFSDLVSRDQLKMIPTNYVQIFSVIPFPEKEDNFENYYSKNSIMRGIRMEDELNLVQRTKTVRKIKRIGEKLSESLRSALKSVCHENQRLCLSFLTSDGRIAVSELLKKMDWTDGEQLYQLAEYQYQFPESHVHLHKIMAYNGYKNLEVFETNISFTDLNCEEKNNLRIECRCIEVKTMRRGSARNIDNWGSKKQRETKHNFEKDKTLSPISETTHVDQFLNPPMVYASLNDPLNGTLACLTLLGGLLTLVIAQYFATFAALPHGGLTTGTSIIGYVILIGLFLLFSTNLGFLLTPLISTCSLRRFGSSFSYAVIFSGMLIKMWSSWRQITSEKTKTWKPFLLLLCSGGFSLFQALLSGLWLILKPPSNDYKLDKWICYPSGDLDSHLILSMVYPIVLLLLTIILGIQTCSKSNNDEARWILISSSLVAIIFSCWGVAIATEVWQMHRTPCTNLATGTILLLCLYIPKIKMHSELKKSLKSQTPPPPIPVEIDKDCSVFPVSPPFPVVLGYNVVAPVLPEERIEPNYLNQPYSTDGSRETISTPFDIDSSSYSDVEQEPYTFSTFLEEPQVAKLDMLDDLLDDPTQVIPSSLYPLDMFNNEPIAITSDHCQPGTNEFTPPHRATSQLYLCPQPEWVP